MSDSGSRLTQLWSKPWVPICSLLALTSLLNITAVDNEFYWDDRSQILEGRLNRSWSSVPTIFTSEVWRNVETENRLEFATIDTYRPLYNLSFLIDYKLAGLNPRWYHTVNLLIHLANIVLVFVLGGILFDRKPGTWMAALFALHPSTITCIHYVSARPDSMTTLFSITAAIFALKDERQKTSSLVLCGLSFLCAMLWKESGILMALAIPVLVWVSVPGVTIKRPLATFGALATALLIYFALRLNALGNVKAVEDSSHLVRMVVNYPVAMLTWLRVALFNWTPLPLRTFESFEFPFGPLAYATAVSFYLVFGALIVYGALMRKLWAGALGWIFLSMAPPVVAATQTEIIDGHYFYLSTVGTASLLGVLISLARKTKLEKSLLTAGLLSLLIACAAVSLQLTTCFKTEVSFYGAIIDAGPHSPVARYNLGNSYLRKSMYQKAIEQYLEVVETAREPEKIHNNLAIAYLRMDALNEAYHHAAAAVAIEPDNSKYRYNLGLVLAKRREYAAGMEQLERALDLDPSYDSALDLAKRLCHAGINSKANLCQRWQK